MLDTVKPQPLPTTGKAEVTPLVIADLVARSEAGRAKYNGRTLKTFNGRDALVDLYQELLDASVYIRQRIEEEAVALHLFRTLEFSGEGCA